MKIRYCVWLIWLLVVCVAGKRGRGRGRKRCGCKAVIANVNAVINKKLSSFRTELLQSAESLPKDTREKLISHKILDLNKELTEIKKKVGKHDSSIKSTRKILNQQKDNITDNSQKISNLEQKTHNISSVLKDVASLASYNSRKQTTVSNTKNQTQYETPDPRTYPKDCDEVYQHGGLRYQGDYYIYIKPESSKNPFKVLCQNANNSGWAVFQKRINGDTDFRKTWREYRDGFGPLTGDFWLGNDKIHELTSTGKSVLRIEMGDWRGNKFYAEYKQFSIEDENHLYKLHVSGYQGNAGDSLSASWRSHDGQAFSTHDRDNDKRFYDNCAKHYSGAWWFTDCFESHLNGKFYKKGNHKDYFVRDGVHWKSIHPYASLRYTVMMTRKQRHQTSETKTGT